MSTLSGSPRTCRWKRIPLACSQGLRSQLCSLPPPGSLDPGSWDSDKDRRGWGVRRRRKARDAGRGELRASRSAAAFSLGSERVGVRGRLPPWHGEFPRRQLGHVRVSAGLWCPGLVWLMPQAQEVEPITCGPHSVEPGVVFQTASLVKIKPIMP